MITLANLRPGFEASVMEAMLELAECVLNILHAALLRKHGWLTFSGLQFPIKVVR